MLNIFHICLYFDEVVALDPLLGGSDDLLTFIQLSDHPLTLMVLVADQVDLRVDEQELLLLEAGERLSLLVVET